MLEKKKNVIQSEIVLFYLSLDIFEVYSGGTVFPRPQQKKMKKLKYLILEQKSYISLCQTRWFKPNLSSDLHPVIKAAAW